MKRQQKTLLLWIVVILIMVFVMSVLEQKAIPSKTISFSQFREAAEAGSIEEVTLNGALAIQGKYKPTVENGSLFETKGPTSAESTIQLLNKANIKYTYKEEEKQGLLSSILINWFPMILLFIIFYFFIRQIQAGGGKAMSFGKSRARLMNENEKRITFKDVAGVEEAKEELSEVVDFLKDPRKYTSLGGKIPKGVLLVGPPGTGKTLLARAVAGEAGVPFFSISGSDFVEMFVGVGASRVRDLFEQGKRQAPCIIFIDEIDAVGRHRGAGMGGGHDEREQTLNQLLVEMDGFESNEGVIIVAATNRMDVLDPALLRPGRFDRRVTVGRPDVRGRLAIIKVHTRKTPLDKDINLENIAKGTPGFTGADLANLVNEAALIAARYNKKLIQNIDFEEAKDKVLMGVARKSLMISDSEKRVTAYHEAGHALVGLRLPYTDPIHKVSIMPRGGALGVTQTLPNEDMLNLTKERANNFISFLMGGRVAEELIFNEITNGASNDIERATELARNMVCHWGMSDSMGTINYGSSRTQPFAGMGREGENNYSQDTAKKIDQEIYDIVNTNYQISRKILSKEKDILIKMAEALIVWETLDSAQVNDIVAGKDIGIPQFNDIKSSEPSTSSSSNSDTGGGLPTGKIVPA
ncbi:MAG: ATP-dependent zinc metalloprotease FtsH [Bacteriovoracaceae bacterium]|nr:ATP-dependent zinc metalloprotease FtsH [Bacteriovoracaceae bacterium]